MFLISFAGDRRGVIHLDFRLFFSGVLQLKKGGFYRILERYRFLSILSKHSHCIVWLAEHKVLGVRRIVKGIPKSSQFHDRLVREAHLMKNLNSPYIPAIYDVEEDDDYTFIIEQFIEGESLGAMLTHRLLSEKELFLFIIRVSHIIKYLHTLPEKIYYLDIKPDNIIIDGEDVFLVDFGSATSDEYASENLRSGTAPFCAPEQLSGGTLNEKTDIYALGRLLEVMVGHSELSKRTAGKLLKIVERARSTAVWSRISTVDIFIRMLEKTRDGEKSKKHEKQNRIASLKGKRIGILGLSPGNGTTIVALSLARYLRYAGLKNICVIENNRRNDMAFVTEMSGCVKDPETGTFTKDGITYLAGISGQQHIRALNKSYDCMIFDLGADARSALGTMWLCDIRIAVGSPAPWRRHEYDFLTKLKASAEGLENWITFVSPADDEGLLNFKDIGTPVWAFPPVCDPLSPKPEIFKIFEKALKR